MGVEIIRDKGNSLSFVLSDVNVSIANALRRTILGEIPVLATEEVEFYSNTSSLYDEVIAHRIGLMPINTDLGLLNRREECKCEDGCPSCQVEFTLKKKGPGVVYSTDFKTPQKGFSPIPGIPIVKLGKNQEIELKALAVLGTGRGHAKWQSAIIGYKNYPIIDVAKCSNCGECANVCPVNILEFKKGKLKVTDEKKCILCMSCVEECKEGAIKVSGDVNRFIYDLEVTGSLESGEIFTKACEILVKKTGDLASVL